MSLEVTALSLELLTSHPRLHHPAAVSIVLDVHTRQVFAGKIHCMHIVLWKYYLME